MRASAEDASSAQSPKKVYGAPKGAFPALHPWPRRNAVVVVVVVVVVAAAADDDDDDGDDVLHRQHPLEVQVTLQAQAQMSWATSVKPMPTLPLYRIELPQTLDLPPILGREMRPRPGIPAQSDHRENGHRMQGSNRHV